MSVVGMTVHAFGVWLWILSHVNGQSGCFEEQRLNLLKLKGGLKYGSAFSTKLTEWNKTTDCCRWPGVSCNPDGDVAALDLSHESIFDGLDHSDALSSLSSLKSLDLSGNFFVTQRIPFSIHKLTSLTELNLRSANLSGPINGSLADLRFLSALRLDGNFFHTPIPPFFANFTNMETMYLNNSFWIGEFPEAIFRMESLRIITVSLNSELRGELPEFHSNSSIRQLVVTGTKFGGIVPNSIGKLPLVNLKLGECRFAGEIPRSLYNLSGLMILELQKNNLTGTVELDWIGHFPNLFSLSLSDNFLTVKANTFGFEQMMFLELSRCSMTTFPFLSNQSMLGTLLLSGNHLQGRIPSLPTTLCLLDLSENNFTSSIPADVIGRLTSLQSLFLAFSGFEGEIPSSLCNALSLQNLFLGSNKLNGPIPKCFLQNLTKLEVFEVGHNQLTGEIPDSFPESCSIRKFDVYNNLIRGPIPKSLANCKRLHSLNLGYNNIFDTFPCRFQGLQALAEVFLFGNMLYGDISCIGDWPNLQSMNLMSNSFTGFTAFLNLTSMASLKSLFYLNVGLNRLDGEIPSALCSLPALETLELVGNMIRGTIPECLVRNLTGLRVLSLTYNRITGSIPHEFLDSCQIQYLGVSFNSLEGSVPKSLAKCAGLEVLLLGNNQIRDMFPCHLRSLSNLKILTMGSNYFHGGFECIGEWKSLRIMDISMNQFGGVLPSDSFGGWDAAIADSNGKHEGIRFGTQRNETNEYTLTFQNKSWGYNLTENRTQIYPAGITVSTKGLNMYLLATTGVFSAIDFSGNQFYGAIPKSIGLLSALNSINLSHNGFSGGIPSSIGKLSNLESLDLSNNRLGGNIPAEFTNLRFLQRLNVSMNQLEGRIPTAAQLQSFPQSSYEGNKGLCGLPLKILCPGGGTSNGDTPPSKDEFDWYLESAGLGFLVGPALLLWLLVFLKSWRICYNKLIDFLGSKLLCR